MCAHAVKLTYISLCWPFFFFFSQVFYLFEPLYHVQLALLPRLAQSRNLAERRVMLGAARDLLKSLYHCHLSSLESYIRPRPANHSTDKLFRRGASKRHGALFGLSWFGAVSAVCYLLFIYSTCPVFRPLPVLPSCVWGSFGTRGTEPGADWWRGVCEEMWAA